MKKGFFYGCVIVLFIGAKVSGQSVITGYEWWFDQSFDEVIFTPVTSPIQYELEATFQTNNLKSGLHSFHIRFIDDSNRYSHILSRFFYKPSEVLISDREITTCQWWIDQQFVDATTVQLITGNLLVWENNLGLNYLEDGLHSIHFRFCDNSGMWTPIVSHFFYKPTLQQIEERNITAFRYWMDDNSEEMVISAVNPGLQVTWTTELELNSLSAGLHTINIQFRDNSGQWSVPLNKFFIIPEQQTGIIPEITGFRYWIDENFASAEEILVNAPTTVVDITETLDLTQIWKGEHLLCFQIKDDQGLWSSVVSDTIIKQSYPIASFEFSTDVFCDSTTVLFQNQSIDADVYFWEFGDGNTSNETEPVQTYTEPGNYTISLTVTDTLTGADSMLSKPITVISGTSYGSLDPMVCDSYVSPSGNYTWTATGIYHDTLVNSVGCDSILTINLTVVEVDTSVTNMDPVLIANAENAEYQWMDCNTMELIPGATGQSFTATMNGTYAVIITQEGCSDTSACYQILSVDVRKNPFESGINVYPNPTRGSVTIELGKELKEVVIFVRNGQGKMVLNKLLFNVSSVPVKIPGPAGTFSIEILTNEGEKAVKKVILE